MASTQPGT